MKTRKIVPFFLLAASLAFLLVGCDIKGSLESTSGLVEIRNPGDATFAAATRGMALVASGTIRTGEGGSARLRFADGSEAFLHSTTCVELRKGDPIGFQNSGSVMYSLKHQSTNLRIGTPFGIIDQHGALFRIDVDSSSATVSVQSGNVSITSNSGEKQELFAGMMQTLPANGALLPRQRFVEPLPSANPSEFTVQGKRGTASTRSGKDVPLSTILVKACSGSRLTLPEDESQASVTFPEKGTISLFGKANVRLEEDGFSFDDGHFTTTFQTREKFPFHVLIPGWCLRIYSGQVVFDFRAGDGQIRNIEGLAWLLPLFDGAKTIPLARGESVSFKGGKIVSEKPMFSGD